MEIEMQNNEKERIDTSIPAGEESNSSEEGIQYRTRKMRNRRQREKCSPLNSQVWTIVKHIVTTEVIVLCI